MESGCATAIMDGNDVMVGAKGAKGNAKAHSPESHVRNPSSAVNLVDNPGSTGVGIDIIPLPLDEALGRSKFRFSNVLVRKVPHIVTVSSR